MISAGLGRPALAAVYATQRPRLTHEENLVHADRKHLGVDCACRIAGKEDGKRRYVAGDDYTVADITALVAIDFARVARIQRSEGHKNLERWHGEVSARPSAKA